VPDHARTTAPMGGPAARVRERDQLYYGGLW